MKIWPFGRLAHRTSLVRYCTPYIRLLCQSYVALLPSCVLRLSFVHFRHLYRYLNFAFPVYLTLVIRSFGRNSNNATTNASCHRPRGRRCHGGSCSRAHARAKLPVSLASSLAHCTLTWMSSNIFGNLPIYCMNDWQAQQVVSGFMNILTNPNRQAANATAQTLIADNYEEISDSINSLAGYPLGSITFNGKQAFINGVINAPYISGMTTLAIYHDCTHITWRWLVTGLGSRVAEVKGVNVMTINTQGQIVEDDIEFNSIAWGTLMRSKHWLLEHANVVLQVPTLATPRSSRASLAQRE